jgi:hypothetical protein
MGAEGRKWSLSILKVLPQASFGETWKTMKNFGQISQCLG